MTGSLKTRLLLLLVPAQAAAIALSMAIFPLITPYISYADIADYTARRLIARSLVPSPEGLLVKPTPELATYLDRRPGFTFAVIDVASGRPAERSDPHLANVVARLGPYLPRENVSLSGGKAAQGVTVQRLIADGRDLAIATRGNVFRQEDLTSFLEAFIPAVGPMFGPLLFGAFVAVPWSVSRVTRPLRRAAAEAALIDMRSLDRRLPASDLPRELLPLVRAINAALDRLDAGVERQGRYTANAAHEMRTPLAILQARVETLPSSPEKRDLRRDVHRVGSLVEQILTMARLGGHEVPVSEGVDLAGCLREVIADHAPLALREGRELAFHGAHDLPTMRGNPRALASAVTNLIDNALRAEPPGGTVEVRLLCVSPDLARIEVADHGSGIEPADRERVFEPFWRKDERPPGTGLGLAIVREVAALHGGLADVIETPGGGATFRMTLPIGHAGRVAALNSSGSCNQSG